MYYGADIDMRLRDRLERRQKERTGQALQAVQGVAQTGLALEDRLRQHKAMQHDQGLASRASNRADRASENARARAEVEVDAARERMKRASTAGQLDRLRALLPAVADDMAGIVDPNATSVADIETEMALQDQVLEQFMETSKQVAPDVSREEIRLLLQQMQPKPKEADPFKDAELELLKARAGNWNARTETERAKARRFQQARRGGRDSRKALNKNAQMIYKAEARALEEFHDLQAQLARVKSDRTEALAQLTARAAMYGTDKDTLEEQRKAVIRDHEIREIELERALNALQNSLPGQSMDDLNKRLQQRLDTGRLQIDPPKRFELEPTRIPLPQRTAAAPKRTVVAEEPTLADRLKKMLGLSEDKTLKESLRKRWSSVPADRRDALRDRARVLEGQGLDDYAAADKALREFGF